MVSKAFKALVLFFLLLSFSWQPFAAGYALGPSPSSKSSVSKIIIIGANASVGGEYSVELGVSRFGSGKKIAGAGDPSCFFNSVREYTCNSSWSFCTLSRKSGDSHINLVFEFVDSSGVVLERGNLCGSGDNVTFDTPNRREYKFVTYEFDCFKTCRSGSCVSTKFCLSGNKEAKVSGSCRISDKKQCSGFCNELKPGCESSSSPPTPIYEEGWKCKNNYTKAYQRIDGSWTSAIYCQYGCSAGECNDPPAPTYAPGWKCKDASIRAYQNSDGSWKNAKYCSYGCSGGKCNPTPPPLCSARWECKDDYTKAYQNTNCSWSNEEHCKYGCSGGECNPTPESFLGEKGYCSVSNKCGAGEGDCDSDNDCKNGLTCMWDEGTEYGFFEWVDVCKKIDYSPHEGKPGDFEFCSQNAKCGIGYGDCDNDSECMQGLHCAEDIGNKFGYSSETDVCLLREDVVVVPKEYLSSEPVSSSYKTTGSISGKMVQSAAINTSMFKLASGRFVVGVSHITPDFKKANCIDSKGRPISSDFLKNPVPHLSIQIWSSDLPGKKLLSDIHFGYYKEEKGGKRCVLVYQSVKPWFCKGFCKEGIGDESIEKYLKNPPTPYREPIPSHKLDGLWNDIGKPLDNERYYPPAEFYAWDLFESIFWNLLIGVSLVIGFFVKTSDSMLSPFFKGATGSYAVSETTYNYIYTPFDYWGGSVSAKKSSKGSNYNITEKGD